MLFTFEGQPAEYDIAMRSQLRGELAQRLKLQRTDLQPSRLARQNVFVPERFDVAVELPLAAAAGREVELAAEIASWEGAELAGKPLAEAMVRPDFPACSRDYDPAAAWWLALLAGLAYQDKEMAARHLEFDGFTKVTFFDVNGTQGFLAEHAGMGPHGPFAVLSFRGTENDFRDVLTDIRVSKKRIRCDGLSAHSGFVEALDEVWSAPPPPQWDGKRIRIGWYGFDGVEQALNAIDVEGPLFMTGHSLGAALATLAAHRRRPAALYTFGSPRVAGTDLAKHLNGEDGLKAWRVVNSTDFVPRVPPPFGYRHVGKLVYLTFEGQVAHYRTGLKALGRFAFELYCRLGMLLLALLPKTFTKIRTPGVFGNHKITEYIRKLEGNLPALTPPAGQADQASPSLAALAMESDDRDDEHVSSPVSSVPTRAAA
jgi:hypothetical protein